MSLFVLASKDGWVHLMYTGLDAVGIDQQVSFVTMRVTKTDIILPVDRCEGWIEIKKFELSYTLQLAVLAVIGIYD